MNAHDSSDATYVPHGIDNPPALFFVYIGLIAFFGLTLALASAKLCDVILPVQLIIGAVQAVLVGIFFMHLKRADRTIVFTALAAIFWMIILFVLELPDFITRHLAAY